MKSPVITVDVDGKVVDGARIMAINKIGCVILIEKDRAVGIVTERDLLERVLAECKDGCEVVMREIMSSPLVRVKKSTSILEAIRIMRQHNIRRLVVMEDDQLVGIVTDKDVLKAMAVSALASFRPLLER